MRLLLLVAFSLTVAAAAQARSSFISGNSLLDMCTAPGQLQQCIGYVQGITDALELHRMLDGDMDCVPVHVTVHQVRDVAVNYLKAHPEDRHLMGSLLASMSIENAWCPALPKSDKPQVDFK
jgi:hypothetical protein